MNPNRNLRTTKFRARLLAGAAVVAVVLAAAPASATSPSTTKTVVLHGAFTNDLVCIPPQTSTPIPDPDHLDAIGFDCGVGTVYLGDLVGHTAGTATGTADLNGNMNATYQEWIYATYPGEDGSLGAIHTSGTFKVDGKSEAFWGKAKVDGGTCSFAGARGTFEFSGVAATGGWTMRLTRPAAHAPADPTCNPANHK